MDMEELWSMVGVCIDVKMGDAHARGSSGEDAVAELAHDLAVVFRHFDSSFNRGQFFADCCLTDEEAEG